jgi:hypothetical protein
MWEKSRVESKKLLDLAGVTRYIARSKQERGCAMQLSAELIRDRLHNDDRWLARALVALNERQTADEQRDEVTRYHNEQGFRPMHAKRGTSMARFYQSRGYLTERQLAWWRARTECGKSRIEIYANQLLKIAESKRAG